MSLRLVDKGWGKELADALTANASDLKIICPFIKSGALNRLLSHRPKHIQVITRFNLADLADGVGDIAALRMLLDAGARVRGIRNLHAKLYLFGTHRAIVTSANLTEAALNRNHEFGLVADEAAVIATCRAYFDDLWGRGGPDLTVEQADEWGEFSPITAQWAQGSTRGLRWVTSARMRASACRLRLHCRRRLPTPLKHSSNSSVRAVIVRHFHV